MCNPRRVIIRLAQAIREEWSDTIEAHITEQAEISAQASLETRVDLAADLGDIVLYELRALLAEGYGGWQPAGDDYTLTLDSGITLRYAPDSGHLRVLARLSETVQATASARGTAGGIVAGQVEAEGEGRYYDDGWGGYTAETAQVAAERDAQRKLADAQARMREVQQRAARDEARHQAEAQAHVEAQARLREEQERRQAVLEERLAALLHESEEQVQAAIGALLGQTYRRAIVRLVTEGGGQIIQDTEQGAIIDMVARI